MTLFWVTHAMPHWTNFGVYTWSLGKKNTTCDTLFARKKAIVQDETTSCCFLFLSIVTSHHAFYLKNNFKSSDKKSMECAVSKELSNNPQELGLHKSRLRIGSQVPMFQMAWSQSKPRYYLPGRYPRPMNQLKLLCLLQLRYEKIMCHMTIHKY